MIRIQGPVAGSGVYFGARGFFCGPVNIGGGATSLHYRSSLDRLMESRGFCGENNCWNFQVNADLTSQKTMSAVTPAPTAATPEAVTYNGTGYSYGTSAVGCGRSSMTSSQKWANACSISDTQWLFGKCAVYAGKVIRVEWYEHTITSVTSTRIYYTQRYRIANKTSGFCALDLTSNPGRDTVLGIAQSYSQTASWVNAGSSYVLKINGIDTFDNESTTTAILQSTINSMILDLNYLEKVDYGMIAQQAVENFNVNNVNMLEFLAGLKNPAALVPKLKNLKRLKGAAGEFLKLQYGILPTISDLEEITQAFKSVRPSIDINGNRTAYAGYSTSGSLNNVEHELTQRVKIAVSANDKELNNLASKLDSIGVLPKMSNLWELVPFSFVIDWFVDIGDYIESVEIRDRILHFDVKYATLSWKRTLTTQVDSSTGYSGSVQLVDYNRWVQLNCPLPSPSLETPFSVSNHKLEAAALAIQRIK